MSLGQEGMKGGLELVRLGQPGGGVEPVLQGVAFGIGQPTGRLQEHQGKLGRGDPLGASLLGQTPGSHWRRGHQSRAQYDHDKRRGTFADA
jgi:hypothetical protein